MRVQFFTDPPDRRMLWSISMRKSTVALLLLLAFLCRPEPAVAYLDPAAGSLILQVVLGGVAGLIVLLKLYWRRLCGFLGFAKGGGDQNDRV